jgi:hypothetical protein
MRNQLFPKWKQLQKTLHTARAANLLYFIIKDHPFMMATKG